jgi:hypothetical protein
MYPPQVPHMPRVPLTLWYRTRVWSDASDYRGWSREMMMVNPINLSSSRSVPLRD